jgi:Protein of unknown function (DUF2911)
MRMSKLNVMLGMVMATGLLFNFAAHADEADQETNITFSTPVQIPGQLLPAGTYMFKLADNDADQNLVQIFNAHGTKIYATLVTNPTDRRRVTSDTTVTLAEQGSGQPDALMKWYYPGEETGHQFRYSTHEAKQLAQDRMETIVAHPQPGNS